MKIKVTVITLVVLAGVLGYFGSVVKAEDSVEKDDFRTSRFETREPSETPRVRGVDRLKDLRLKFCENHKEEINNRLTSLGNLVASMLGKFDAIAVRVEDFYKTKALPAGKVVSNYDALVAEVSTKRTAVETALANSQKDVTDFSCTGENPKGQIRLYRTDMQLVKKALQEYRTSIKNLIVAIRSVVGETNSESPKPSASPI